MRVINLFGDIVAQSHIEKSCFFRRPPDINKDFDDEASVPLKLHFNVCSNTCLVLPLEFFINSIVFIMTDYFIPDNTNMT